jgi:hypothetical protein
MTSIPANLPHRHEDHDTCHILRIDPVSGEVITRKPMIRRKDVETQYQEWAAKRRADRTLTTDFATVQAAMVKADPVDPVVEAEPITQARGRPKTKLTNPAAAFMPFLVIPDPLPWVDDIIQGSIITSAGVSNGKINVKARAVIRALFLSEISAEACQTSEHTLRTAQRIAKAARHAAHGIASYIERHPAIRAGLEVELGADRLYQASPT